MGCRSRGCMIHMPGLRYVLSVPVVCTFQWGLGETSKMSPVCISYSLPFSIAKKQSDASRIMVLPHMLVEQILSLAFLSVPELSLLSSCCRDGRCAQLS